MLVPYDPLCPSLLEQLPSLSFWRLHSLNLRRKPEESLGHWQAGAAMVDQLGGGILNQYVGSRFQHLAKIDATASMCPSNTAFFSPTNRSPKMFNGVLRDRVEIEISRPRARVLIRTLPHNWYQNHIICMLCVLYLVGWVFVCLVMHPVMRQSCAMSGSHSRLVSHRLQAVAEYQNHAAIIHRFCDQSSDPWCVINMCCIHFSNMISIYHKSCA